MSLSAKPRPARNAATALMQPVHGRIRRFAAMVAATLAASLAASLAVSPLSARPAAPHCDCTELARAIPASDQGDTYQCWALAIASRFELEASAIAGAPLKLSPRYLVYASALADVTDAIVAGQLTSYLGNLAEGPPNEEIFYEQGGDLPGTVTHVLRMGAMPENAYPGFPREDVTLYRALNALMRTYRDDPALPRDREQVAAAVRDVLEGFLGAPPAQFEFAGRSWTPVSFREHYLPSLERTQAREISYERGSARKRIESAAPGGGSHIRHVTGRRRDVIAILSASLRAGQPVLLSYVYIEEAHASANVGFRVNGVGLAQRRRLINKAKLNHYVLALEGRFDRQGRLQRILVKNTFGAAAEAGHGLNWIERDYLTLIDGVEIPDARTGTLIAAGRPGP